MRAVLDEGVPRDLVRELAAIGCQVAEFPKSWKGLKNGALLAALEAADFDCLMTCDRNLHHQQNLAGRRLAVVLLPGQRLDRLLNQVDGIAQAIRTVEVGQVLVMPYRLKL